MKTKYKYIFFEEDRKFDNKPLYICRNNKSKSELAMIFYYATWKQYCFTQSGSDIVLSQDCLLDIADFLKQLNGEKG